MTLDFTACQSFAGGFDVGMTQAGFQMVHKVEQKGGFGLPNCLANRAILGERWEAQAGDPADWDVIPSHVVIGNPPCSGFSALSHKDFRGINSPANACMHVLEQYVARVNPYIAVFESVQQAYSGGADLMRYLHAKLEYDTQQRWNLHHVLHNNASVGGASIRKRYFWLVSRIPFGIEPPEIDRVPRLHEVIGDLRGLGQTWEEQPYRYPASWWVRRHNMRNGNVAVDGHTGRNGAPDIRRHLSLLEGTYWNEGEILSDVARRYYEQHGRLPDLWKGAEERLVAKNWMMGYHQPSRWRWHKMGRVITGAGLHKVMHPVEDRFITHREVARIQGFPDDWRILPLRGQSGLSMTWGKGIPVHAGRWIGGWIRAALEGNPGSQSGKQVNEREFIIDVTNDYRKVCEER